jgi:hypothetical protein
VRREILAAALLIPAAYAQVDPKALVEQSIVNYNHDWREAMSWSYIQTDMTQADDATKIEAFEVIPLAGTPYDRLILRDGEPLDATEKRKEDRKFDKTLKERSEESPEERADRIQKYEKARAFIDEVPNAYDFKLLGSETVNGRPAWVVQLTPRMGFVPESPHASILRHIVGKLWIDKQDVRWAKAEAPVMDKISIGVILARIGPGTNFKLEQTRITDDLWLPSRIAINGAARVLLFYCKNLNEQLTFSGYHKESSTSATTQVSPTPGKSFR